ncbi:unnamed protein product [Closterium sp. Yama58-4]|nr:unnamed protein product [Closterium sp. Yama58-4]
MGGEPFAGVSTLHALLAAECAERAGTYLGSTKTYPVDGTIKSKVISPPFNGILSGDDSVNPAFYNWNLVRVVYCDGGGFLGTRGRVSTNGDVVYMDGWNIIQAILKDLQANRGIRSASRLLISGSSAGGQAVVHLCDTIAAAVPSADARCVVDSGFFVDSEDRSGSFTFRSLAQKMVALHQPNFGECAQAYSSTYQWRCFFPQYTISRTVSTPLFIFNTLFDNIALTIGKQLPDNKAHDWMGL